MTIRIWFPRAQRSLGLFDKLGLTIGLALIAVVAITAHYYLRSRRMIEGSATALVKASPPPRAAPSLREIVGVFEKNQTIVETLARYGLARKEILHMVDSARPVYNLARIRAHTHFWLRMTPEGQFHDFRYAIDDERYLTVYRHKDEFVPVLKRFPFQTRMESVAGTVEDSLFLAVTGAGEQDQLALDLAGIFASEIDFYTDIQKGDTFRILVEKKYLDGRFEKYGPILAAAVVTGGKLLQGFRFSSEAGKFEYYDPDGKALRKSFLKSPLKFARITSSFSRGRYHPILKVVRPHLGVDYGAPEGTPVVAVGSGAVTMAGRDGGNGRMVRLRHARELETLYLHLSRITVSTGTRVARGAVIGYVGSTGLTTGSHLDFRVIQRGRYINPAKVVLPPAPPVPPSAFSRFASLRDSLQAQLEGDGPR